MRDIDAIGKTGQRLVHRVVDDFVDQVVQSHLAGRSDVHRGTFADRFHAAEDLDRVGVVVGIRLAVAILAVGTGRLHILELR